MGRKSKVSSEIKILSVKQYLSNNKSILEISKQYLVSEASVRFWVRKFKTFGEIGLYNSLTNTKYSAEFKQKAVLSYLSGEGSQQEICKKYKIHSICQLQNWILKYNSHEELKSSKNGGISIMTKGRKTTYEERIEIVTYCIEHGNNYDQTADKYKVSYQQVYTWLKKYEEKGFEGLIDNRGKRKQENNMSEVDKLRAENRMLQAKYRKLELESIFLKKLEEIERRRS